MCITLGIFTSVAHILFCFIYFFYRRHSLNLTLPHKRAHFYFRYSHTNQPSIFIPAFFFPLSLATLHRLDHFCAHEEQQQQQQQQEKVVFNTLMNFPMMLACVAEQTEMQTLIPSVCFYNTCSITKMYFWFCLPDCISVNLASVEI